MTQGHAATWIPLALLLAFVLPAQDVQQTTSELPADLKTVETLKAYEPKTTGPKRLRPVLGIRFGAYRKTGAEILSLEPGSPAAAEGLLPGDLVRMIGRYRINEAEDLENALPSLRGGQSGPLFVKGPGVKREALVELGPGEQAGDPGFDYRHTQGHFEVTAVRGGSAAARAGLKVGDCFSQVDKVVYTGASQLRRALKAKTKFSVLVQREESTLQPSFKPAGAKEEEVLDWKGKTFKLAVLLVEFSDRKHNAKYTSKDFERLLFSVGEYTQSPDGRKTYGSLRDYYKEISVATFNATPTAFDWLRL